MNRKLVNTLQTVSFHTLGCKVNQYDSQAMLEKFQQAGYTAVPFSEKADVYVVNTCTVTGTGDKKSMQLVRRLKRQSPLSEIVVAGCLAQRMGEKLRDTGARLILGNQHRGEVVTLLEKAVKEGTQLVAVDTLTAIPFERLSITAHDGYTRAVLKIQEGCQNNCTYCIIPSVRGPIRSRPIDDIETETRALVKAGFTEMVLTGIHLTSYGRDLNDGTTLLDAIRAVHGVDGVERIRLGSLEPTVATQAFVDALKTLPKVCPQFHLALQSGSDTVLRRMARRYNMQMYFDALNRLRTAFPDAAFTTDVLTGFPGETQEEFLETVEACKKAAFAKMHVFPYSQREGTKAAVMPGQLTRTEKENRARLLIALSDELGAAYRTRFVGRTVPVLFEDALPNGHMQGFTPEYVRVEAADGQPGQTQNVLITGLTQDGLTGEKE